LISVWVAAWVVDVVAPVVDVVPEGSMAVVVVDEPDDGVVVVDVLVVDPSSMVVDVVPATVVEVVVVVGLATAGGVSVTRPLTAPTAAVAMRTLMTVAATQAITMPTRRFIFWMMVAKPVYRVKRRLSHLQGTVAGSRVVGALGTFMPWRRS
jgi:hypothetical protein